jgi:Cu/Ag efflux pump CusA
MPKSSTNETVQADLTELRNLMTALPTTAPGSAVRALTIQLIRQLLDRVGLTIKSVQDCAGAELERKLIQDWFDDTLLVMG